MHQYKIVNLVDWADSRISFSHDKSDLDHFYWEYVLWNNYYWAVHGRMHITFNWEYLVQDEESNWQSKISYERCYVRHFYNNIRNKSEWSQWPLSVSRVWALFNPGLNYFVWYVHCSNIKSIVVVWIAAFHVENASTFKIHTFPFYR